MWTYLLGPLLAFLPMRWRARLAPEAPIEWPIAGLLSGFAESVGGLATFFWWYFHIMQRYLGAIGGAAVEGKTSVPVSDQQIGGTALFLWLLHPVTWAITYFTFEGALRLLAALVTEESPASLPLVLVERMLTRARRKRERARGPSVRDEISRGEGDKGFIGIVYHEFRRRWHVRRAPLVHDEVRETLSHDAAGLEVRSCRPKPEWREGRLVRYEEGYYRVESSRVESAPRPFIFVLRKLPAGRPTKSVLVYTPDEPLQGVGRL
jgi:hypothetical protein